MMVEFKSSRLMVALFATMALALFAGQATAGAVVSDILDEPDNFVTVFGPMVSGSDLADASNGGSTAYSGGGYGTDDSSVIDGAVQCCSTGDGLLPHGGGVLEVFLDTSVNTAGYDITSIVTTTGWNSASRADQQYHVDLRSVGGDYAHLISVDHDMTPHGSGNGEEGSMLTVSDNVGGLLGSGIDAIRFRVFENEGLASPQPGPTGTLLNGNDSFQEVDVFGSATIPEPSAIVMLMTGIVSVLGLVRRGR